MAFENRRFIIINYDEHSSINFDECYETLDTLTLSVEPVAGIGTTATYVKCDAGELVGTAMTNTLAGVSTYLGPYTHQEMLGILTTSTWQGVST